MYSQKTQAPMLPGTVKKIVGSSTGGTTIDIDGVEYTAAEWTKKYLGSIGPDMKVMFSHEGTLLTKIMKAGGHAPVKAPSEHQEGTKMAPSEAAKNEFGVSGTPEPQPQKTTPPDTQRMIVRQSCLKVACDAWCCSNHEKKDFDVTLAEIIKGMKILEEAVFRDQ